VVRHGISDAELRHFVTAAAGSGELGGLRLPQTEHPLQHDQARGLRNVGCGETSIQRGFQVTTEGIVGHVHGLLQRVYVSYKLAFYKSME